MEKRKNKENTEVLMWKRLLETRNQEHLFKSVQEFKCYRAHAKRIGSY